MKLLADTLSRAEIDNLIQIKLNWILAEVIPLQVFVVGSAASGTMKTDSDVDIILVFKDQETLSKSMKRIWKARPQDDWPMDLLAFTKVQFFESVSKGGGVCWLALREGKLIYNGGEKDVAEKQSRKIV